MLFHLAAVLVDAVGSEGVVARLGGEEFSVLLPCADVENAGVVAERLMARVRAHQPTNASRDAAITMSVGIAVEPVESAGDSASLHARADEALYMAKRSGRDRVLLWAPGVRSLATPAASMAVITQAPRRAGQPYVR